jgi:hypothetical protein
MRGALRPFHAVHDQADDRSHDCAGDAAADELAGKRADIHAARPAREHRDERSQKRPARDAADRASDRVPSGPETHIFRGRASCVAADRARDQLNDKIDDRR